MPIIRPEEEAIRRLMIYHPRRTGWRNNRGGGDTPFVPPTGIWGWYDFTDTSTVTESSNVISAVSDKSGNGYDLSVGTGAPGYSASTAIAGFNSAYFSAGAGNFGYAGSLITTTGTDTKQSRTTFLVAAPYALGGFGGIFSLKGSVSSTSTTDRIMGAFSSNSIWELYGRGQKLRINTTTGSYTGLPGFPVLVCVRERQAGTPSYTYEVYSLDTGLVVSTLSDNDGVGWKEAMFGRSSTTQALGSGEVYEALIYPTYLSDEDFTTVISYLRNKYGM